MIYLGKKGLNKTWQQEFPENTKCVHCKGNARIGFVYQEDEKTKDFVSYLHDNDPDHEKFWLHDAVAVAVYFCEGCLEPTALYNQA